MVYYLYMGRGAATCEDSTSILYGHTPPRTAIESPKTVELDNGVVEEYDEKGELWKIIIPEGVAYEINKAPNKAAYETAATIYLQEGSFYRDHGPAVIRKDGQEEWYFEGKLHREDGPAITQADGSLFWYYNDELHRQGGPAVEWAEGGEGYYKHGKPHREDGPAISRPGEEDYYYIDGQRQGLKPLT